MAITALPTVGQMTAALQAAIPMPTPATLRMTNDVTVGLILTGFTGVAGHMFQGMNQLQRDQGLGQLLCAFADSGTSRSNTWPDDIRFTCQGNYVRINRFTAVIIANGTTVRRFCRKFAAYYSAYAAATHHVSALATKHGITTANNHLAADFADAIPNTSLTTAQIVAINNARAANAYSDPTGAEITSAATLYNAGRVMNPVPVRNLRQ